MKLYLVRAYNDPSRATHVVAENKVNAVLKGSAIFSEPCLVSEVGVPGWIIRLEAIPKQKELGWQQW